MYNLLWNSLQFIVVKKCSRNNFLENARTYLTQRDAICAYKT